MLLIVCGTFFVASAMTNELMPIDREKATLDADLMQSEKWLH